MSTAKPSEALGARLSLQAHAKDNVATLLDAQVERTTIACGLAIDRGIPFGHKVALCQIADGGEVIKFGVVIGHATAAIGKGEHVHVHNVT